MWAQPAQTLLIQADIAFERGQYEKATVLYDSILNRERTVTQRMLQRQAYMAENRSAIPQTLYYLSLLYSLTQDDLIRLRLEALARQYQLEGYDYDEWDLFRQALRNYSPYILGFFNVQAAAAWAAVAPFAAHHIFAVGYGCLVA